MAHIMHPIVADRPYGCNKQNKIFKEKFNLMTMLLHAEKLVFEWEGKTIEIHANPQAEFKRMLNVLKLSIDQFLRLKETFKEKTPYFNSKGFYGEHKLHHSRHSTGHSGIPQAFHHRPAFGFGLVGDIASVVSNPDIDAAFLKPT